MIPLTLANTGEDLVIKKVGGSPDVKKHLEDLGLIAGSTVMVVNTFAGNVILNVRNSRIAVNSDMAKKIMV
jgi:ferrous iron transport protein A